MVNRADSSRNKRSDPPDSDELATSWTAELGLTFYWDVRKLWEVDLPIKHMPLTELDWLLDQPFWKLDSHEPVLRPRDVACEPTRYPDHYQRTLNTDLSYPINAIGLKGRWVVMDGLHRLLKATILGHSTILTKLAHEGDIPKFSRRPDEPSNHP